MLRAFAGLVYGVALVVASIAVGAGGHGFATFFGVAGAPFAFFIVRVDKIGLIAIPIFWAAIASMARIRKASNVFLALIGLHYLAAVLWIVMRRSDLGDDMRSLHSVTTIAIAASLIYLAGQALLWRDFSHRS